MSKSQNSACRAVALAGWLLSPTRKIIDLLKCGSSSHHGNALRRWSLSLFYIEAVSSITLMLCLRGPSKAEISVVGILVLAYACSRINEIAYAFYNDALSLSKKSDIKITDRIRMAMRSYLGLLFNFSLLYYFMPVEELFNKTIESYTEAFYFSGVTLATLGYGDIFPKHALSRLLALYEVIAGILIIAVAIAIYVGGIGKEENGA